MISSMGILLQDRTKVPIVAALTLPFFLLPITCNASQEATHSDLSDADETTGRLYITRSERREAGVKHLLTPWLTASFLLEVEGETEAYRIRGSNDKERQRSGNATLQMGFIASPWEMLKAKVSRFSLSDHA